MAVKPPSKTQVLNSIAEETGLKKQEVISVLDSLTNQISTSINGEAGAFTIPGLCKIVRQNKPATEEREMKSPFTGEMITVSAKPARKVVKIRPLKNLKDMVADSSPAAAPAAAPEAAPETPGFS